MKRSAGRWIATATFGLAGLMVLGVVSQDWLVRQIATAIEARFPVPPQLTSHPHGIIVLGGDLSYHRRASNTDMQSPRIEAAQQIARKFPRARIVISGAFREAEDGRRMLIRGGLAPERIAVEVESRSTWENATNLHRLLKDEVSKRWILITSRLHMPRAMGTFRHAGFSAIAWPVADDANPSKVAILREARALIVYRLAFRTDALLPAP